MNDIVPLVFKHGYLVLFAIVTPADPPRREESVVNPHQIMEGLCHGD
jgi:hypothetical protein